MDVFPCSFRFSSPPGLSYLRTRVISLREVFLLFFFINAGLRIYFGARHSWIREGQSIGDADHQSKHD